MEPIELNDRQNAYKVNDSDQPDPNLSPADDAYKNGASPDRNVTTGHKLQDVNLHVAQP